MAAKLPIGGYRFSEALVQINQRDTDQRVLFQSIERLAAGHINLVYVAMALDADLWTCSLAVASQAWPEAKSILAAADIHIQMEVVAPVGTLTVFPHQSRLDLLAGILDVFEQTGLPVYSVLSSLSTLTFATDYHGLDTAARMLMNIAQLPQSAAAVQSQHRSGRV